MDTVVSGRGSKIVLTERASRFNWIIKLEARKQADVIKTLDGLEKKYKDKFSNIFKSITVERGSNENANKLIRKFIKKGDNIGKFSRKDIKYIYKTVLIIILENYLIIILLETFFIHYVRIINPLQSFLEFTGVAKNKKQLINYTYNDNLANYLRLQL